MEVNKKLIECWNWGRFGIRPEDIHLRIYPAGMEVRNAVRMRGFLEKFDQRWTLTFSLDDFKPILYPAATPEATETLLHSKLS
jgi:hypothetical protein